MNAVATSSAVVVDVNVVKDMMVCRSCWVECLPFIGTRALMSNLISVDDEDFADTYSARMSEVLNKPVGTRASAD